MSHGQLKDMIHEMEPHAILRQDLEAVAAESSSPSAPPAAAVAEVLSSAPPVESSPSSSTYSQLDKTLEQMEPHGFLRPELTKLAENQNQNVDLVS